MTDDKNAATEKQPSIRVIGQYIRDLSFENPNIGKLMEGPVDNPQLGVEVNVNAKQVGSDLYESMLSFAANATSKIGPLYKLELEYGGTFKIENMPAQAMEPFLLINAPTLLFPFVRRLVSDLTREGGFPPLLLDPIDFAALYMQRQAQASQQAPGNGSKPLN